MTTTTELRNILPKKDIPLPLEWLIATGQEVTEEKLQAATDAQKYPNRERFPEPLLHFADLFNELTGQKPIGNTFTDWIATFEEWKANELEDDHIRASWNQASDPNKGFTVGRPGALTVVAKSVKSMKTKPAVLQINRQAIEQTQQMLEAKETKPTPIPDDQRARRKAALARAKRSNSQ